MRESHLLAELIKLRELSSGGGDLKVLELTTAMENAMLEAKEREQRRRVALQVDEENPFCFKKTWKYFRAQKWIGLTEEDRLKLEEALFIESKNRSIAETRSSLKMLGCKK